MSEFVESINDWVTNWAPKAWWDEMYQIATFLRELTGLKFRPANLWCFALLGILTGWLMLSLTVRYWPSKKAA